MSEEAERTGSEDRIISKAVKEFPQHFRAKNEKANLQKSSRWWKDRESILSQQGSSKSVSSTSASGHSKIYPPVIYREFQNRYCGQQRCTNLIAHYITMDTAVHGKI
ncbi:hypothetical protein R1sor_018054 [Riccia sorocarpa]|uniref:Uncharacterized protein n=1 Tax=Riccia sorocarpa TaxID=122646 RepID=A0ABD3ICN2_9MARC